MKIKKWLVLSLRGVPKGRRSNLIMGLPRANKLALAMTFFLTFSLSHFLYCEQEIDITSDKMEYDKLNSKSVFTGNVKLKAGAVSLICDTAQMDIEKKDIYLENVFFYVVQS